MLPDSFKDGVSAAIALVLLGIFAFVYVSMIIVRARGRLVRSMLLESNE